MVSISENNIFYENYRAVRNDSSQTYNSELKFKNKIFYIEPAIGYHRFVRDDIAIGIDFGIIHLNYKIDDSYQYDNSIQSFKGKQYRKGLSLHLNVMERFAIKKYLVTTVLSVPLEWVYKAGYDLDQTYISDLSQSAPVSETSVLKDKKAFTFGLYFKGGIHRAIYKKLYLGMVFTAGLRREHYYGEMLYTVKASNQFDEKVTVDYQKFNVIQKELFSSFVLSYYF